MIKECPEMLTPRSTHKEIKERSIGMIGFPLAVQIFQNDLGRLREVPAPMRRMDPVKEAHQRLRLKANERETGFIDGFSIDEPITDGDLRTAVARILFDAKIASGMMLNALETFPGGVKNYMRGRHVPSSGPEFDIAATVQPSGEIVAYQGDLGKASEGCTFVNFSRVSVDEVEEQLRAQLTDFLRRIGKADVRQVMWVGS